MVTIKGDIEDLERADGKTEVKYDRDLDVHVNKSFNFNEHCEKLLIKANQQFGILKRTCHFVTNKNRRRVLYLALVWS